jgi:multidrug/hemolysin transport system ATP-binding protein
MQPVISVKNLVKKYGSQIAVDDVSFSVESGSVFSFLGPNGAGKSTTIGCLTTLTAIDQGIVTVNGYRVGQNDTAIRRSIGVVFQNSLLDPLLSVRENLESRASLYKIDQPAKRMAELAKLIDLTSFMDKPYGALSGGQKRRTDIARALIHNPSILFLDEPTAGLDPQSRERVWQTVYDLQAVSNLTVFLTTHYLEETERADMVYVIDNGKVIAHNTPDGLRQTYTKDELRLVAKTTATLIEKLKRAKIDFSIKNEACILHPKSSAEALKILETYKADIKDFEFRHGTMDDVFLQLTGTEIRETGTQS